MSTGRAIIGIGLVALGTLLLLGQAGMLDAGRVVADWWPVLFFVAAALELSSRPRRPIAAGVFAVVGLVLLAATTGLMSGSALAVAWPVGIIALGAWLLLRRAPGPMSGATGDETFDAVAIFSGRRIVSTSGSFRGGDATAVFGGVEVDLTGAGIDGIADIEAAAVFGGVDIEVPPGWRVLLDGPAIFGGHENKVPAPADPDAPTLRIRATAVFGAVEASVGATWPVDA